MRMSLGESKKIINRIFGIFCLAMAIGSQAEGEVTHILLKDRENEGFLEFASDDLRYRRAYRGFSNQIMQRANPFVTKHCNTAEIKFDFIDDDYYVYPHISFSLYNPCSDTYTLRMEFLDEEDGGNLRLTVVENSTPVDELNISFHTSPDEAIFLPIATIEPDHFMSLITYKIGEHLKNIGDMNNCPNITPLKPTRNFDGFPNGTTHLNFSLYTSCKAVYGIRLEDVSASIGFSKDIEVDFSYRVRGEGSSGDSVETHSFSFPLEDGSKDPSSDQG